MAKNKAGRRKPRSRPAHGWARAQPPPSPGPDAPLAFVIMPFGLVFDQVYERLFMPLLTEAGYRVQRADTLLNQQAIMRDVIEGIVGADLVWADLTGGNANVFYELGIAHALEKNTVLLAQRRDDIPFDLRSYKNHVYRVEFATAPDLIDDLRPELSQFLRAVRDDEVVFGSPYSDFGPATTTEEDLAQEDETGLLDRVLDLQSVLPEFTTAIEEATALSEAFTSQQTVLTEEMQTPPNGEDPLKHVVAVGGRIGELWDRQAEKMDVLHTEKLGALTLRIERGAKASLDMTHANQDNEEARKAKASLRTMAEQAAVAAETQMTLAAMTRDSSKYLGSLRKPGERLASAYERFATSFGRIAALESEIDRTRSEDAGS